MDRLTEIALGQLIGFSMAKDGYGLIDLVEGMALQESEWEEIK